MKISTLILIALAILAILLVAAAIAKQKKGDSESGPWPFYPRKILSQPEQILFHRLVKALPNHIILAQVQLSRALGVKKGFNFHEWNNRINRMSLDFVICGKDSSIILAVELDDSTHERKDRVEADTKKLRALSAAGVPLVRWSVQNLPDETAILSALPKTAA